jgi:hypothetical protein
MLDACDDVSLASYAPRADIVVQFKRVWLEDCNMTDIPDSITDRSLWMMTAR